MFFSILCGFLFREVHSRVNNLWSSCILWQCIMIFPLGWLYLFEAS
jgi:hypothetical protein